MLISYYSVSSPLSIRGEPTPKASKKGKIKKLVIFLLVCPKHAKFVKLLRIALMNHRLTTQEGAQGKIKLPPPNKNTTPEVCLSRDNGRYGAEEGRIFENEQEKYKTITKSHKFFQHAYNSNYPSPRGSRDFA